jgi:ADP-ribose pyrophosphatase YjhB (NUDIX family)
LNRHARYQGAIIRDHHILLIKHVEHETGHAYWIFPGGGREDGETGEECVRREMQEETGLDVRIVSLLTDEPQGYPGSVYQRLKTYLCEPLGGEATPGFEPEPEHAGHYSIVEAKWFDLRSEADWEPILINNPWIYLPLQDIRRKLGYIAKQV